MSLKQEIHRRVKLWYVKLSCHKAELSCAMFFRLFIKKRKQLSLDFGENLA